MRGEEGELISRSWLPSQVLGKRCGTQRNVSSMWDRLLDKVNVNTESTKMRDLLHAEKIGFAWAACPRSPP